jgi:hypothetical protein
MMITSFQVYRSPWQQKKTVSIAVVGDRYRLKSLLILVLRGFECKLGFEPPDLLFVVVAAADLQTANAAYTKAGTDEQTNQ